MVSVILTDSMINAGKVLILKLDQRGKSPEGAFWLYSPDIQQWKLMLVYDFGNIGPKIFYKKIQDTIYAKKNEIGELSLVDVVLLKPDDPIVSLLRSKIRTGPDSISGIRFTNNVINGTVIDDAYIYRLR